MNYRHCRHHYTDTLLKTASGNPSYICIAKEILRTVHVDVDVDDNEDNECE
jgi:hypothetical protein